jgi:hypothetical protein
MWIIMRALHLGKFCLCFAVVFSGAVASAQTAGETITYIDGKIAGQVATYDAYRLRLDGVRIGGSLFTLTYAVIHETDIGTWADFFEEEVDLTAIKDFTQKSVDHMMQTEQAVVKLECDGSHGNCVKRRLCMNTDEQGKCDKSSIDRLAILYFDLNGLGNSEEEKRVKKAILHLKELFPLKKNKEIFDDE